MYIAQYKMPYNDYSNDDDVNNKDTVRSLPLDKNFHRIYRKVVDEKKTTRLDNGKTYYKKAAIDLYGTGSIGTRIRNAVTGSRYNYLVGSAEQKFLFSVALCTGENGLKEHVALFYDSPDQYECHMRTTLNPVRKSEWRLCHM